LTENEPAIRANLSCRAYYWYSQAIPSTTGEEEKRLTAKRSELQKSLPAQRPIILYARYGTDQGWADVATRVRTVLSQSPEESLKGVSDLKLGIDPAPGHGKSLVIVYRFWDTVHISITEERAPITVPIPSFETRSFSGRLGPDTSLIFARYGAQGSYIDVSSQFTGQVRVGKDKIALKDLNVPDPLSGRNKNLVLVYRRAGKVKVSITRESEAVDLAKL
jgi:hypothetical protein